MKTILINYRIWLFVCALLALGINPVLGASKKSKVRMSVQYVKVMNEASYLEIHAKARGKHGYQPVGKLQVHIFQVFNDSTIELGKVITNANGAAKFKIDRLISLPGDTTGYFRYKIKTSSTADYKASKKSISIYDVNLKSSIASKDSTNFVLASVTNPTTGKPVSGVDLQLQIIRTLAFLNIDKDVYTTNDEGEVLLAVPNDIPGKNGVLGFKVTINDSDDYGTVESYFEAPIGVPFTTRDTFDKRTMWSPPTKTPLYLLIGPNLIILGIWLTLFILIHNLYKISKSS